MSQPTTTTEQIAFHKQILADFQQSVKSKQEQIALIQEQIAKENITIANTIEKLMTLSSTLNYTNIATNGTIPADQVNKDQFGRNFYNGRMLKAIYTEPNSQGVVKYYIDNKRKYLKQQYVDVPDAEEVEVNVCDLQLGDIVKNNFTTYYRNECEYCKVVKITDSQVQFMPYANWVVGYSGDQHSFNETWYKSSPTVFKADGKPHRMNKMSSWKKRVSHNTITKYLGIPDNMFSHSSHDGGY